MAIAYLYVLPLHGEDWLKLGISNDPLRRAREFSPRFHETFDLAEAFVVETEARKDAAALEKSLRHTLRLHRAPVPLTIRQGAGGHTEWLRGAHPHLLESCRESPLASVVHYPATPWFADAQWQTRTRLHTWASGLLREFLLDPDASGLTTLPAGLRAQLHDAIDTFHAFGQRVGDHLPHALQSWYAALPDLPGTGDGPV